MNGNSEPPPPSFAVASLPITPLHIVQINWPYPKYVVVNAPHDPKLQLLLHMDSSAILTTMKRNTAAPHEATHHLFQFAWKKDQPQEIFWTLVGVLEITEAKQHHTITVDKEIQRCMGDEHMHVDILFHADLLRSVQQGSSSSSSSSSSKKLDLARHKWWQAFTNVSAPRKSTIPLQMLKAAAAEFLSHAGNEEDALRNVCSQCHWPLCGMSWRMFLLQNQECCLACRSPEKTFDWPSTETVKAFEAHDDHHDDSSSSKKKKKKKKNIIPVLGNAGFKRSCWMPGCEEDPLPPKGGGRWPNRKDSAHNRQYGYAIFCLAHKIALNVTLKETFVGHPTEGRRVMLLQLMYGFIFTPPDTAQEIQQMHAIIEKPWFSTEALSVFMTHYQKNYWHHNCNLLLFPGPYYATATKLQKDTWIQRVMKGLGKKKKEEEEPPPPPLVVSKNKKRKAPPPLPSSAAADDPPQKKTKRELMEEISVAAALVKEILVEEEKTPPPPLSLLAMTPELSEWVEKKQEENVQLRAQNTLMRERIDIQKKELHELSIQPQLLNNNPWGPAPPPQQQEPPIVHSRFPPTESGTDFDHAQKTPDWQNGIG